MIAHSFNHFISQTREGYPVQLFLDPMHKTYVGELQHCLYRLSSGQET